MSTVRLGFIGLGYIPVHAHLPALQPLAEAGEVVFQAFCDPSEETVAEQGRAFGASAVYTDHRRMFDQEELDAVYICIPPTAHTDEVTLAAAKGVHILVEKPQTLYMRQAVELDAAIQQAGVIAQVGFMSRYYPAAEFVRQLLASRTPRHAQVQLFYSGAHIRYWTSRYELCGGTFVENTIHLIDLLRYFLGDIDRVSAFYHMRQPGEGPEPINMPHVYDVNYGFASGVTASATTSRVLTNTKASRREVLIISDDSLIEWSAEKVVENGETVWEAGADNNAFALQSRAFVDAVRRGDAADIRSPYSASLNSLAAVLGANASAEQDGAVLPLAEMISGSAVWSGEAARRHP
jgi:myo-inositol 2-dehydrogenase / D-chiro-inositol 1-dehydrogenase